MARQVKKLAILQKTPRAAFGGTPTTMITSELVKEEILEKTLVPQEFSYF